MVQLMQQMEKDQAVLGLGRRNTKEKRVGGSSGRARPRSPGMKIPGWCTPCVTARPPQDICLGDQLLLPLHLQAIPSSHQQLSWVAIRHLHLVASIPLCSQCSDEALRRQCVIWGWNRRWWAYLRARMFMKLSFQCFSPLKKNTNLKMGEETWLFFYTWFFSLCSLLLTNMLLESLFYFLWYFCSYVMWTAFVFVGAMQEVEMPGKAQGSIWMHGRCWVCAWGWQGLIVTNSCLKEAELGYKAYKL